VPYETILYDIDQGVGTITLNRPPVLNAINAQMIEELHDVLGKVKEDAAVRSIVITGAGRGFCSGADLKSRQRIKPGEVGPDAAKASAERLKRSYNPLILAIRSIEKPFIASVNGVAAGAGCNIALACDIVLASEQARFHVIIEADNFDDVLKGARIYPGMDGGHVSTRPTISFHFENFGKTPAFIKEVAEGIIECSTEPPIPVYTVTTKRHTSYMIASGGVTDTWKATAKNLLDFNTTKEILSGNKSLWFYGKIIFKDVFGNEHWHRFYWCFNGNRQLQPYDYEHYNESY